MEYTFPFNLSRDNEYLQGYAVFDKTFLTLRINENEQLKQKICDVQEWEYHQYIGCAAIDYTIDGLSYELCRCDMKSAHYLQSAVKRLNAISNHKKIDVFIQDEIQCCPKCGLPFRYNTRVCIRCVDKGKVMKRILPYLAPHKKAIFFSILMFLLFTIIQVLLPYLNRVLIDSYILADDSNINGFFAIIAVMVFFAFSVTFLQIIRNIVLIKVGNRMILTLREDIYKKVQELSLAGIGKKSAGEIIHRITEDTMIIKDFLVNVIPELLQMILLFVVVIGVMTVINWQLSLLIIVPVPFVVFLFSVLRKRMNRLYHKQWTCETNVNTLLHDVFSGIRVVKVFGTEQYEMKRFQESARKVANISQKNERMWNLIMPFANFLLGIGEYAVLMYVGTRVINGTMQLGELMQFITYVGIIYGPIRWAAFLPRKITQAVTSGAKVFELLDEEIEIQNSEVALEADIDGNIEFDQVNFGYNDYEDVLKEITLPIKKGEMVGFVGRSGVGKSTFINLVLRLYDVKEGVIEIDGRNIKDYDQQVLRSQIGVVLQETYMFRGTIYSNIEYARPGCTSEDVMKAARIANAHEFIMKLPDAYNTMIGEKGQTLSGGERQRIAIARAILRNPKILILDEATASLDTETEKMIQDALQKLIEGRTTIAIAHRLSTLRNATKLVVLEKGCIEEVGSHDDLMKNRNRYYKLVMAQRKIGKMTRHTQK